MKGGEKWLLNKMKGQMEAMLTDLVRFGASSKNISDAKKIFGEDLKKLLIKTVYPSRDFKSFYAVDPNGHRWKSHENEIIKRIKLLYKHQIQQHESSPKIVSLFNTDPSTHPLMYNKDSSSKLIKLSDREIVSNMAIVFAETDFWEDKPNDKDIADNRKLLDSINEQKIKKLKNERRLELYFDRKKKRLQKSKKLDDKFQIKPKPQDI